MRYSSMTLLDLLCHSTCSIHGCSSTASCSNTSWSSRQQPMCHFDSSVMTAYDVLCLFTHCVQLSCTQADSPCKGRPVSTTRVDARVHVPSTRPVNSGSGNPPLKWEFLMAEFSFMHECVLRDLITYADGSCVSMSLIRLCDSVCLCVCDSVCPHDKTKMAETKSPNSAQG